VNYELWIKKVKYQAVGCKKNTLPLFFCFFFALFQIKVVNLQPKLKTQRFKLKTKNNEKPER